MSFSVPGWEFPFSDLVQKTGILGREQEKQETGMNLRKSDLETNIPVEMSKCGPAPASALLGSPGPGGPCEPCSEIFKSTINLSVRGPGSADFHQALS